MASAVKSREGKDLSLAFSTFYLCPVWDEGDGAAMQGFEMSGVIRRAIGVLRAEFLLIAALSVLIVAVPSFALSWWRFHNVQTQIAGSPYDLYLRNFASALSGLLLGALVTSILQAAMTRVVVAHGRGNRAKIGDCLGTALAMILPLTAITLLAHIGTFLGLILLVVPGLMLWTAWMVVIPVQAEERGDILTSFGRSMALTRGARWPVFGSMFGLLAAIVGVNYVIRRIALMVILGTFPLPLLILNAIVGAAETMVAAVVIASLYVELRKVHDEEAPAELETIFA